MYILDIHSKLVPVEFVASVNINVGFRELTDPEHERKDCVFTHLSVFLRS